MLQPKDWIWIFRGKQEKNESMWFIDFCWMLTPLKPFGCDACFFLPRFFCAVRFELQGTSVTNGTGGHASKYKEPMKQLKVGFLFCLFCNNDFLETKPRAGSKYIKIANRLPRLMILKEVRKNTMRLGSILTDHLHIYFCKSLSEFAHHLNLQVFSGACPYFKTTTFGFYFTEVKRFKQGKNVHQQMATTLSQQIWLPSLLRSWATRAEASQPWQFRLGDGQSFSYKKPIKWSGFCLTFKWFGVCISKFGWKVDFFAVRILRRKDWEDWSIAEISTAPWRI